MRVVVIEPPSSIPSKSAPNPWKAWASHERERTWFGSNPSSPALPQKPANPLTASWSEEGLVVQRQRAIWPWKVNACCSSKKRRGHATKSAATPWAANHSAT